MKITALIENRAEGGLHGEHGLAVHIEYNGRRYLLDTGGSEQFLDNADRLGVDLEAVNAAVLSHAHYDHAGGFPGFFARNARAKVYLREEGKEQCFARIGPFKKYIGIPKGVLETYADRFVYVDNDLEIDPGVWLIGHRTPGLGEIGKRAHMYRRTGAGLRPDDFGHEHSLVFDTAAGLVLFNSCCHAGADTIVTEVREALPGRPVAALFGGFHLMGLSGADSLGVSEDNVRALGKNLIQAGVARIYTGHCTGTPAFELLRETMGGVLHYFETGMTVEL